MQHQEEHISKGITKYVNSLKPITNSSTIHTHKKTKTKQIYMHPNSNEFKRETAKEPNYSKSMQAMPIYTSTKQK